MRSAILQRRRFHPDFLCVLLPTDIVPTLSLCSAATRQVLFSGVEGVEGK